YLLLGQAYYFWLEISEWMKQSIEKTPTSLPELAADAEITVVLWEIDEGLRVNEGSGIARLRILAGGSAEVLQQPSQIPAGSALQNIQSRAYFPVRVAGATGIQRLRCNIYCEQVLLQSHIIRAVVVSQPASSGGMLSSEV